MALPASARRRLPLLALAVLLLHLLLADWVAGHAAALRADDADPRLMRLSAAFVNELQPAEPPPAPAGPPAAPAAAPPPRVAPAAAVPASAPAVEEAAAPPAPAADAVLAEAAQGEAESEAAGEVVSGAAQGEVQPAASSSRGLAEAMAGAAAPVAGPASAAAPAASPAASAPVTDATTFDWPRSTRLSYRLTGHYRGPVEGQAQVEWLRDGVRYQVHLEVSVGPSFAPLVSRRMSSDGHIVPQGLQPRLYEEETKVALQTPRRVLLDFEPPVLRLANGRELPRPAQVQDTASQFVQLTWLFTTRPALLQPGQSVPLVLALPRRVDEWVYDVVAHERLYTPVGALEAVHVKPRRPARPGGELVAEAWFAPTLQYLPVRIVIRQDDETYVDLLLARWPEQAGASGPPAVNPAR